MPLTYRVARCQGPPGGREARHRRPSGHPRPGLGNPVEAGSARPVEHDHRQTLRGQFAALRACVPLDPGWLDRAIQDADPAAVPAHDLAYLVSGLGDAALWRRCKPTLMAKVDSAHERALASCILTFRDGEEREWLEARVVSTTDLVGPMALRALTAIDPQRALALLDRLDDDSRYLASSWWFAELYLRLPAEVMAHFASALRRHDRPWRHTLVLQGREDLIDPDSFDFPLDRLASLLAEAADPGAPADVRADCRTGLAFVIAVNRWNPRLGPRRRDAPRVAWRRGRPPSARSSEW